MAFFRTLIFTAFFMTFSFACSSGKIPLTPDEGVKVDKVIHVYGDQLIVKKNKYTVRAYMTNLHGSPLVFHLGEILCFRGKDQGITGYSNFGIGERTIDFAAGQQKQFNFGCTFGERQPTGPFKIVITRIYENPSGDRVTAGKVIKENVVWNIHNGAIAGATQN